MSNKKPNILFLLSDEHSFRCMGHVPQEGGGESIETPAFDKLASHGTVFSQAYCQMPLCTPSRISLLTGLETRKCGAWGNASVLRPELPTIPSTFRDAGYTTCLVGKMHLGGTQQFIGFQHRPYGDLTGQCGHQSEPINDPDRGGLRKRTTFTGVTEIPESLIQDKVVVSETISFLREQQHSDPEKPWFLCASFSRPHFPLTSPKRHFDKFWPDNISEPKVPADGDAYDHPMSIGMREGFNADAIDHDEMMRARAAYFACVTYLDETIGDLLETLERDGLLENTIIVYTTDHGELAGEHGVWWKNGWYEGCTRVPLIVSLPEQRHCTMPHRKCQTPVGLYDLFPTFCALADIEPPAELSGTDLSEVIKNDVSAPERPIFTDALTPRWGEGTEFRMIRFGKYKYIRFRNAPPLAFNLEDDPEEQHNLLTAENDAATQATLAELAKLAEEVIDFDEVEKERTVRDGDLREQYKQNISGSPTGNLYFMPDGRVINADDNLYSPTVIAENPEHAFEKKWASQN
jgi:choline-sulfatase